MKTIPVLAVLAASSTAFAPSAFAQETAPAPRVVMVPASPSYESPPPPPAASPSDAPPANTGFQLALRSGYMLPLGSATGAAGDDMSKSFSGQVPLLVDIGGKPDPHVFVGAYGGVGFGGAGSGISPTCDAGNLSCTTRTLRIGVELQYHFAPDAAVNPWLGYGIGWESTSFDASATNGGSFSLTASGPEYAHLSAGVDFRVSPTVGIGPVLDFAVGQYSHESGSLNGATSDADITNTAMHQWFMVGARLVFFP